MKSPTNHPNPWPVALVAFFTVFISFIVGFIVFATRQKIELVNSNYYDDEMRFQQQLDRVARARAFPTAVRITCDSKQEAIFVTLPADQLGRTVQGLIHLYRPSDSSLDRDLPLDLNAEGVQRVESKPLRAGLWKVRVEWKLAGEEFSFDQPVIVSHPSS